MVRCQCQSRTCRLCCRVFHTAYPLTRRISRKASKSGRKRLVPGMICDCLWPDSCGAPATRETDTMDTFVDSSWYYLRYCDPGNETQLAEKSKSLLPVDLYIGGVEHAILHLLYARFIAKYLHGKGIVEISPSGEPFTRLLAQGMVKGKAYKCSQTGKYISPASLRERPGIF